MVPRFIHLARLGLLALLTLPFAGAYAASARQAMALGTRTSTITLPNGNQYTLTTPADLQVSLYATGVPSARFMALGPRGDVFVGSWYAGTVDVLLNRNGAKQASRVITLLSGLVVPHSVAYHNGQIYVGLEGAVSAWNYNAANVSVANGRFVVPSLPVGGRHVTRTIGFGLDGALYVSVGSSCNECVDAAGRAVIMKYAANGANGQVYARGLRNAVGFAWQSGTGRLWSVDNGEDSLGNYAPPDEIDLIKQGANYGWPYCYDNAVPDPNVSVPAGYCAQTTNPVVDLPAHSAPLGLTFSTSKLLPARYRGGIFVAYHGSMYRSPLTGYKVVYIPINGAQAGTPQDVVAGWLPSNGGAVWGRPVGLLIAADGSLLISDDDAGVIYRVAPVGH